MNASDALSGHCVWSIHLAMWATGDLLWRLETFTGDLANQGSGPSVPLASTSKSYIAQQDWSQKLPADSKYDFFF